jgi:hypothetical protein
MICRRCGCTLVDQDEVGWYYQIPVNNGSGLTFMDRVHECGGKPHEAIERKWEDYVDESGYG